MEKDSTHIPQDTSKSVCLKHLKIDIEKNDVHIFYTYIKYCIFYMKKGYIL